jgi:hypothetical protein
MDDRSAVRVLVFPVDDAALRRDVEAAMRQVGAEGTGVDRASALERRLRQWYRSLQVHQRDELGGYPDEAVTVWYVYRDGRIRRPNETRERLYAALAQARDTCGASAEAMERARVTAGVAGFRWQRPTAATSAFDPVVAQRGR